MGEKKNTHNVTHTGECHHADTHEDACSSKPGGEEVGEDRRFGCLKKILYSLRVFFFSKSCTIVIVIACNKNSKTQRKEYVFFIEHQTLHCILTMQHKRKKDRVITCNSASCTGCRSKNRTRCRPWSVRNLARRWKPRCFRGSPSNAPSRSFRCSFLARSTSTP